MRLVTAQAAPARPAGDATTLYGPELIAMSITLTWVLLLLPIATLIGTWVTFLDTKPTARLYQTTKAATLVLTISYLLILAELLSPEVLGAHYSDRRAYVILGNCLVAAAVLVAGLAARSWLGSLIALSSVVVGLGWIYMAVIGTAV